MNSKDAFCEKVRGEHKTNNESSLPLETLKNKAQTLFAKDPSKVELIAIPNISELYTILSDPIWEKVVAGSSDTSIARLIYRLDNSDWVSQGRGYLDHSGDACPFCQQGLPLDFKDQLKSILVVN